MIQPVITVSDGKLSYRSAACSSLSYGISQLMCYYSFGPCGQTGFDLAESGVYPVSARYL